jgi:glycine/D-amino acid oxidase-like deaminating enzyme/nitrite reductase/ring-hydroxylating ferredoxin subunit
MNVMHASLWIATSKGQGRARLAGDVEADVCVVGGGIAGLTAARLAQKDGRSVVVVEAGRIAARDSGHTTAHLTEILDHGYVKLRSHFGAKGALMAAVSARVAIETIERLAAEEGIACRLSRVEGWRWAESADELQDLEEELDAMQQSGLRATFARETPLPWRVAGAIRVEEQAQFHPREYLLGLADRIAAAGGQLFEGTRAIKIDEGDRCTVETERGVVRCRDVVVATHHPISSKFALHTKIAPYRTYAVAARVPQLVRPGLYYDSEDPYHYVRTQETSAGTFLIVGGEDHKVGHEEETHARFDALERWTLAHFEGAEIAYRWSGQVIEPADGLPFIGRAPLSTRVYVATGFSGTGMTFGTLAGMVIADAIAGRENPFARLYDATRVKPLAQARRYVAENVDYPAALALDRVDRGQVARTADVPRGEGRLVRVEGDMVACYREPGGALRAVSAVCTHLGCHVRWNDAERSWDCPCHGSRFDTAGRVLNGPAVRALEAVDVADDAEPRAQQS